jgi:hypothetical protein
VEKVAQKLCLFVIFKKLSKVNHTPIGENSTNRVTLLPFQHSPFLLGSSSENSLKNGPGEKA